ncbi:HAD family hydrolase [Herbaspirillum huttiense]|jgi:haloacid dehalogenase superfamily, subfamily IA, variant 3 with third motif having DD or ED|uniref:HAD-IA family hydrolase n=1 Tax=Herbaspirillum huttiense subsp. lycopersici TaxID=3074428 RepID=A0ABU2ENV1_9BURK|nr:HAD-IA family hydrolase [Herbaspirillum huttiense]MDR9849799.1 HAD-IA family hydrolase [Herbaspirillum huttiense SE1]
MMARQAITHLICDCDGVLLDSESIALRVLHRELLPLLPAWSGADDDEQEEQRSQALHTAIAHRLGMYTDILLGEVDLEFELGLDASAAERIHQAVAVACGEEAQPVPGVVEALQAIRLPRAVASNSDAPRIEAGLRRCGLYPQFAGRIYSGHDVAHPKPAPDVYLAAAAAFNVDPARCVAVDDSVTGVRAAVAAGMYVLGFTGVAHDRKTMARKLKDAGAHQVFEDMKQFPQLVSELIWLR